MKERSLRPTLARAIAAAFLAALAGVPAPAQDAAKSAILQNKADQVAVRQHTDVLAGQIQGLIDELAENGISGEDIKVLNTTKAVLNNLTAQEMQRVIASLQQAGDAAGTKAGEKSLVDAYGAQKGIILQFRQILKDYEQRQAADVLPAKFKELTDRQTQTMWTTAQVATNIAGKSQQELNTMQQTTAQIVQTDQTALANDVATAKQMIDRAAQNATGDQGRAIQQAQKDLASGKLQEALDKANADLADGHLLQATTEQKIARDQLRQLAKDLNPPTTTADALADFTATLNKLIDEQKDLLSQTNAATGVKPRVTGLDAKQGMLVDKTNSLQEDMQPLSPDAAGIVKSAIAPMQLARADLGAHGRSFDRAAASEQDAIDKLEQAAQQLSQQLADAQKAAADAAKDSTQKLQDLQNQLQQAQQQQQQTQQQTAQAQNASDPNALSKAQQQQQQLQQQAQNMQQAAAPLSLPAAQALADAQKAMQQAQQAMTDPSQAQQAQQAQQQAAQDLQQAQQAVAQQIAQNQQQATDPAQMAQAANQLQQAQNNVSNAMADAQQQQQAASPSMQQAQQQLQQAAQATQAAGATPGLPDAAQSAVKDAQKSIAKGQQDAAKGDAKSTAADAAAAQASLAQAQAAVAVAQAGMTPTPSMAAGPPNPNAPPMPVPGTQAATQIGDGPNDKGDLHNVAGNGKFITVMSRERTAISETQGETRPQEYSPMIDQYLKNLSDQATSSSQ